MQPSGPAVAREARLLDEVEAVGHPLEAHGEEGLLRLVAGARAVEGPPGKS